LSAESLDTSVVVDWADPGVTAGLPGGVIGI